jgi:hypothetical protein
MILNRCGTSAFLGWHSLEAAPGPSIRPEARKRVLVLSVEGVAFTRNEVGPVGAVGHKVDIVLRKYSVMRTPVLYMRNGGYTQKYTPSALETCGRVNTLA